MTFSEMEIRAIVEVLIYSSFLGAMAAIFVVHLCRSLFEFLTDVLSRSSFTDRWVSAAHARYLKRRELQRGRDV